MILCDQLFDVRQHQHAATRQSRQLSDDQAFSCAGGQHNRSRLFVFAKPGERRVNGFLLIGAKCKSHRFSFWFSRISMPRNFFP
ncbi:hypothetical protein D3C78_1148090 [compost metagenome]